MSIEVEEINNNINNENALIDAVDELPPNIQQAQIINNNNNNIDNNNDDLIGGGIGRKHIDIAESSPSPSSHSSTSLDLHRTRNGGKLSHPLSASYKEWLNNWFSISIPAIGFLGCQLSLALQNGFVTPELEELGISEKLVNYCWLAPPLTGICFLFFFFFLK